MKIIKINKCFEECPHCTVATRYNKLTMTFDYTCQEMMERLIDENVVPDWCPLPDGDIIENLEELKKLIGDDQFRSITMKDPK